MSSSDKIMDALINNTLDIGKHGLTADNACPLGEPLFFSTDEQGYMQFHDSAEKAQKAAQKTLKAELQAGAEPCETDAAATCWGRVYQRVHATYAFQTCGKPDEE